MKYLFVEKLCCPIDKTNLKLEVFEKDSNEEIFEGLLTCNTCNRYYPIVHGIPIMSPDEYREKLLEEPILQKWGLKLASDSNSKKLLLEN